MSLRVLFLALRANSIAREEWVYLTSSRGRLLRGCPPVVVTERSAMNKPGYSSSSAWPGHRKDKFPAVQLAGVSECCSHVLAMFLSRGTEGLANEVNVREQELQRTVFCFLQFKTRPLPISIFGGGEKKRKRKRNRLIQLSCTPPVWVLHELWIFYKDGEGGEVLNFQTGFI